jgi:hypothetical protein
VETLKRVPKLRTVVMSCFRGGRQPTPNAREQFFRGALKFSELVGKKGKARHGYSICFRAGPSQGDEME